MRWFGFILSVFTLCLVGRGQSVPTSAPSNLDGGSRRKEALASPVELQFALSLDASDSAARNQKPETRNPAPKSAGFTLLSSSVTGVTFTNRLSPGSASQNQILLNGSGVAAGDVNGDGLADLFFCSLGGGNKLFLNEGGFHFRDATINSPPELASAGIFCTGAVLADLDGDGDLDLLIGSIGSGVRLFLNDGQGHFVLKPDSGLSPRSGSTSMALADIDNDGDLDLYAANYRTNTIRSTGFPTLNIGGKRFIRPEDKDRLEYRPEGLVLEHGEPDALYINDGHARFSEASWTDGRFLQANGEPLKEIPREWGLSAAFRDLNGDGSPDLYVCNDFQDADRLWFNDGSGRFRMASVLALRNSPTFSMCIDFADINRDGFDDFFVADMLPSSPSLALRQFSRDMNKSLPGEFLERQQFNRNVLQLGRGDGSFAEAAYFFGLEATGWTWGALFLDVDLDGYEDLLLATGNMFNTQDLDANERIDRNGPYPREFIPKKLLMYPPYLSAKLAFRNARGTRFEEKSSEWGFNQAGISHGLCLADLDNDGDMDVVVNNLNESAGIYRNESSAARIGVRLRASGNSRGIGAKILVEGADFPLQSQQMMAGGRYLSSDDPMRSFAAGAETNRLNIRVLWPDGKQTGLRDVRPNQVYEIEQREALDKAPSVVSTPAPQFEDRSIYLQHRHHDDPFDDEQFQPLIPRKLSQLGPGAAWCDIDQDGWEDLLLGAGRGGRPAIYLNKGGTNFISTTLEPADRDLASIIGVVTESDGPRVFAALSNYEDRSTNGAAVRSWSWPSLQSRDEIASFPWSPGALALGEIDGSGSLSLFVGGRVLPGRYPEAVSSKIYRCDGPKWRVDTENSSLLENIGLVSGAVWADLNGDGFPELVLALDWGTLRLFQNDRGKLADRTREWGLDHFPGWWNGVAVGDFNGDGRLDLAASNWGLNTAARPSSSRPERLYYLPAAGERIPLIEAAFDSDLNRWLPRVGLNPLSEAFPALRDRFRSHAEFAATPVESLLAPRRFQFKEAAWLQSTVFLNRGSTFQPMPLPDEAQLSPAFGISVADFDGDGREDLFLAQNVFAVQPFKSRCDAGRGLLLRGRGDGSFIPVPGQGSGILIYGEQRGCAAADFDHDGRVDLVVTQNGNETKLYRNKTARPGLRVALRGGPGNPNAIGAILRLNSGPARVLTAGSGYWSQDGAVQVLAQTTLGLTNRLEISWPGGTRGAVQIPPSARAISVQAPSQLTIIE